MLEQTKKFFRAPRVKTGISTFSAFLLSAAVTFVALFFFAGALASLLTPLGWLLAIAMVAVVVGALAPRVKTRIRTFSAFLLSVAVTLASLLTPLGWLLAIAMVSVVVGALVGLAVNKLVSKRLEESSGRLPPSSNLPTVKLVMIGEPDVGKSSLISSLKEEKFSSEYKKITELERVTVHVKTPSMHKPHEPDNPLNFDQVKIEFLITSDDSNNFKNVWLEGNINLVLVYDDTNQDSFEAIQKTWLPILKKAIQEDGETSRPQSVTLIANHREGYSKVVHDSQREGLVNVLSSEPKFQELLVRFSSVNAETGKGVKEAFREIAQSSAVRERAYEVMKKACELTKKQQQAVVSEEKRIEQNKEVSVVVPQVSKLKFSSVFDFFRYSKNSEAKIGKKETKAEETLLQKLVREIIRGGKDEAKFLEDLIGNEKILYKMLCYVVDPVNEIVVAEQVRAIGSLANCMNAFYNNTTSEPLIVKLQTLFKKILEEYQQAFISSELSIGASPPTYTAWKIPSIPTLLQKAYEHAVYLPPLEP